MDIELLLKEIEEAVRKEAKQTFGRKAAAAVKDSAQFLKRIKDDLGKWAQMLEDGQINQAGFMSLVEGHQEVFRMHAMKQKGIGLALANEFRDKVLSIIIEKTVSLL